MQQIALNNNQFESLATKAFKNLHGDKVLTDVKLVTADDKQIKAHKVVLGAISKFFKSIFTKNQDDSLLIYLKDISHKELSWIIDFIYLGQCMIDQTDLERFVAIGKDLKVEGIMEEDNNKHAENETNPSKKRKSSNETNSSSDSNSSTQSIIDPSAPEIKLPKTEIQIVDVDDPESTMEDDKENTSNGNFNNDGNAMKAENDYYDYLRYESQDLDNNYTVQNVSDPWAPTFKESYAEVQNIFRNEEGKYPCDECTYQTKSLSHIKTHKLTVHQGVRYYCDQCDYQATKEKYVDAHKLRVHSSASWNWETLHRSRPGPISRYEMETSPMLNKSMPITPMLMDGSQPVQAVSEPGLPPPLLGDIPSLPPY